MWKKLSEESADEGGTESPPVAVAKGLFIQMVLAMGRRVLCLKCAPFQTIERNAGANQVPRRISCVSELCPFHSIVREASSKSPDLQPVQTQRPFDASKIKIVGAKDFKVSQLIPQAQLMVCLELVPMAGPADTLKVFPAVWIASLQSPNQSRRHDVVHMAPDSCLLEIYSTGLHLALPTKR